MLNRKLLEILKRLDAVEIKQLRLFLQSPYFTYGLSNQYIILIFEYIIRYRANEHAPELDKKRVSAKLFPDKAYNEKEKSPIDTLTTDLLRLTKRFLFIQSAENDTSEPMKELPVARFYRKFGLTERFRKSVQQMRDLLDAAPFQDEAHFLDRYYVEEEVSTFKSLFNSSEDDINIGTKAQFLEKFFTIVRMDIACAMNFQHQMVDFNQTYSPALANELIRLIREEAFPDNELATIYLLVLDIINNPDNLEMVEYLKSQLEERKGKIPPAHLKNLMTYLRVFIIRRYQKNEKDEYLENYFELITHHLDEGYLYYDGKVLAAALRNITYTGLRLGAYEKVLKILEKHPPERIGATRYPEEFYSLNLANYYFALKDYDEADKHLIYCNFDNIHFSIQAEILHIKIFYETNNELLDSRIKALQQKVRRSTMAKDYKERYAGLLNRILLMIKYGWEKDNPKHAKLIEEIRSKPGLLEKEWLLKQLQ
jgi:hypothetical protein